MSVSGIDTKVVTSAIPFAAADVAALRLARRYLSFDLPSAEGVSNGVSRRIRLFPRSPTRRARTRTESVNLVIRKVRGSSRGRRRVSG